MRKTPFPINISIHALLAECDSAYSAPTARYGYFNPRTPCGVRPAATLRHNRSNIFQSTHSLRSATGVKVRNNRAVFISIHALLAECDGEAMDAGDKSMTFQSTHSLRSATFDFHAVNGVCDISIHALLAECDDVPLRRTRRRNNFNPRTPCGVRPSSWCETAELL